MIEIPHIDKAIISKLLNTCAGFVTFKDALPEIAAIIKKRNSAGWKLVSTTTAIVDTKNNFSNLYLFWEKY